MNPELGPDVKTAGEHEERDRRPFLLVLMGLAGILTIALIVSADQSYAGIDGLRAITAYPPAREQDPPQKSPIPVLTRLLDGIRDLPIFAPAPVQPVQPVSSAPPAPVGPSAPPSTAPSTPTASPAPSLTPAPAATPAPTPAPPAAPTLTLTTDRGGTAAISLGDLVPGDTVDRTITLKNTGNLGFRYTVSATQTAWTLLWTDTMNGLQLTVATGTGTILYSGPLSGLGALPGPATVAPGGSELLRYTFDFPAGAPDTLQGLVQDLTLVFTATQYP